MPSSFHSAPTLPIGTLTQTCARPARLDFTTPDGLGLVVEPHAPGVFRLRLGVATHLAEDQALSLRERARQDMLLARVEAVCEASVDPLPNDGEGWRVTQGDTVLEIRCQPLRIALYRSDVCVLASSDVAGVPVFAHNGAEAPTRWVASFALNTDEALYGLGETTGNLNRRGETILSDNPEHRALPLIWSPCGWGVYVNTFGRVVHELGTAKAPDAYALTLEDLTLDLFLFAAEPGEILNQYSQITGRAGQPTLSAMGLWLTQLPGQDIADTLALAQEFRNRQVSLDAVQLAQPSAWRFTDSKLLVEWDAQRCPDSRQMLAQWQEMGVQLVAPTFPGILADTPTFVELEDRGWLLAYDNGDAHVFPGHPATGGKPYALLDLTHRDVYTLWVERHRQLADEGVGALACDVQIDIPDDVQARSNECEAILRTVYPLLARRALFEALAGHKTPQEAVVLSADLFPAAQRLPWQSGPRVANTWEGMADSLRAALSIGASGVPVQMHTLGSAHAPLDTMTPELYLRWLTCNVFSANFAWQAVPGLLPWDFDEATLAHVHTWLQWRARLTPYVLGAVEDAARTGLPVQRSMALSFPHDSEAHAWNTQYLLGPALLVAPPIGPGDEVRVYLPKGEAWWDLNTGWRYEGGTTWTVRCGSEQFPVFGREGHMLCLGPVVQHTGEINSARILDEVWMFGMPVHNPVVMRNKVRVMQMQGSSYIKGLEGLRILASEGLEIKRRGAEVRISRVR